VDGRTPIARGCVDAARQASPYRYRREIESYQMQCTILCLDVVVSSLVVWLEGRDERSLPHPGPDRKPGGAGLQWPRFVSYRSPVRGEDEGEDVPLHIASRSRSPTRRPDSQTHRLTVWLRRRREGKRARRADG
jgi:hypothetical protein